MTYTIKQFHKATGQIIVQFGSSSATFTVDVPVKDGLYITGGELVEYINAFEPRDFISRQEQIASGIANSSDIEALAEEVITPLTVEQATAETQRIEDAKAVEMEKYVKAALIKLGVISV
jgi:signal recognition particle GTPase